MNPSHQQETMRPSDIFLYLIGNRAAIHRIAATPWAWLVGAVLVLTAGLARNYDHLDLLRQPSWYIGPFAASIFSTLFIFLWVTGGLKLGKHKGSGRNLLTFLNLFWLTAPCAWIYGIPVELFTDILTATKWNIAFLAIVSIWRVALIIRAVSILTESPWPRVTLLILTPAAFEMMVGSFFKGRSIVGIMGGVRLPPEDALLIQATNFTSMASFWTFVICLVAILVIRGASKKPLHRDSSGFPKSSMILACTTLLIWILIAIPFQPVIQNRHHLEELIRQEKYEVAIEFASSKQRSDFPKIHYLAPDPTIYRYNYPLEPLEKLPADAPEWLREEWTNNAIVAYTSSMYVLEEQIDHLKTHHPEIFAALRDYQATLESKSELTWQESSWLSRFQGYSAPAEGNR